VFPTQDVRNEQYAGRAAARPQLLRALHDAGLASAADPLPDALPFDTVRAVHAYLARTPSALMAFQLEDVFGVTEQDQPSRHHQRAVSQLAAQAADRPRGLGVRWTPGRDLRGDPRRRSRALVSIPRATYRVQLHRGFTFRDRDGHRAVPRGARCQSPVHVPVF
jgi:(1->4)-alpha-D-glucan 1-alpha-D-glucosylmutase